MAGVINSLDMEESKIVAVPCQRICNGCSFGMELCPIISCAVAIACHQSQLRSACALQLRRLKFSAPESWHTCSSRHSQALYA